MNPLDADAELIAELEMDSGNSTLSFDAASRLRERSAAIRRVEAEIVACEEMARMSGGDVSMETVARWFRAAILGSETK